MGLFDIFKNNSNHDDESNANLSNKQLLEKLEFRNKIIIKLEKDLDAKNKEIKELKEELEKVTSNKESNIYASIEEKNKKELQKPNTPVSNNEKQSEEDVNYDEMREKLLEAIKEKTKIKSYHITPTEITDGDIFISKFGGLGYWDKSMEYPKDSEGNDLVLLAQINFDKEKINNSNLPSKGLLQFYVLPDTFYGANFDNLNDKNTYKVIYHENVNYDVKREDLSDIKTNLMLEKDDEYFPFDKEFKIEFEEKEDYISPVDYNFKEVLNNIVKEEFDIDVSNTPLYKVFGQGIMDYLNDKLISSGSKLLGYPYFTQTDPREIDKYNKYKILLFQMDSDSEVGIMWGDVGIANFFITEDNNFEDTLYTWDCT